MTPAGAKFGRHAGFGSLLGIADIAAQAREETRPLGFELAWDRFWQAANRRRFARALL
jgi:hypothetical protein